jgi:hypothetical protein
MRQNRSMDRNVMQWGPEHGDPMLIKDIPMDHFVNILNWIWDNFDIYEKHSPGLYKFMESEAGFRRLLALAGGGPYPHKVGSRYRLKN